MKKLKIYLALLAISTLFLLSACKKPKSCSELLTDYSAAVSAWLMNQTQQTCEDLVNAASEYLDHCSPADRQSIEDLQNEDRSQYP